MFLCLAIIVFVQGLNSKKWTIKRFNYLNSFICAKVINCRQKSSKQQKEKVETSLLKHQFEKLTNVIEKRIQLKLLVLKENQEILSDNIQKIHTCCVGV